MMRFQFRGHVAALLFCLPGASFGQAAQGDTAPVPGGGAPAIPIAVCNFELFGKVEPSQVADLYNRCYWAGLARQHDATTGYYARSVLHRTEVLEFQQLATVVTFYMVMAAIVFSVIIALRKITVGDATDIAEFKLEAGSFKLELHTRMLGILLLVFSAMFFYLYVDRMYEIGEIGAAKDGAAAAGPDAQ